jgi:hypothetical protein
MKEIEDNLEGEQRTFRLIRQMQGHIFTMRMTIDKQLNTGRDTYNAQENPVPIHKPKRHRGKRG